MLTNNTDILSGRCESSSAPNSRLPSSRTSIPQKETDVHDLSDAPAGAVLRRARFLQGLSPSERKIIVHAAQLRSYAAGSVVAEQGTAADRLFLLWTGAAHYFFITPEGRRVNLFWLVPGDIFGGACLLTVPSQFLVSTSVTKKSSALVWQRETIRALAVRCPRLLENALSIASDYLIWYLATHLSLVSNNAHERLAHVLVSLSGGIGTKRADGVGLEITNEQLADTANMTLFTVSRLLSEWQRSGALTKNRGHILICHPERLFDGASNTKPE